MSDHDARFELLDAAYVLGSLGPTDRREFEDHLQTCPVCQGQVADLTALPGLMRRLSSTRALALAEPAAEPAVDPAVDPAAAKPDEGTTEAPTPVVSRTRPRRRFARPLQVAGAVLVAAAIVVLVMTGIRSVGPGPALTAELTPTAALGGDPELTASVKLYQKPWGTEVDTECRHRAAAGAEADAERYGLYVVGSDGRSNLVSSWQGVAASPIETVAATATPIARMNRLELRSIDDGQLLLSAPVHG